MAPSPEEELFQGSSSTFYPSSQLFPGKIREDVFRLYSFLRLADDYVDVLPQKPTEFLAFKKRWQAAAAKTATSPNDDKLLHERVIKNMLQLVRSYDFEPAWIEAFLDSMQADLSDTTYQTLEDTLGYVYGSAEVVGLMMAKIMRLPPDAMPYARLQGRAWQWINFIRDIAEDNKLGRCYFPAAELERWGLKDLHQATAETYPSRFRDFMFLQCKRYRHWQLEAQAGYAHIPKQLRVPLETASGLYAWTATQIQANPHVVYEKKLKPPKSYILHAINHA